MSTQTERRLKILEQQVEICRLKWELADIEVTRCGEKIEAARGNERLRNEELFRAMDQLDHKKGSQL